MLVRASLGMAIAMSLMGMAHNVWELVGLRLFAGFAGGYSSGATILVATQTPKRRSGWALGMLNSGIMAGSLVGPLIGGTLPPLIGIRATFWLAGGVIFLAFLATTFLIKEEKRSALTKKAAAAASWSQIPDKRPVIAMLAIGLLLTFANMSIEPIITLYVGQLVDASRVTFVSGLTMSAAALGAILSAARLGKLADRIGHWPVVIVTLAVSALLLIPQAFVTAGWQLVALRFLMGLALGGLMPCVTSIIRHNVPDAVVGRVLGYATSSNLRRPGRGSGSRRLCRRPYRHARGVPRHRGADGARRRLCAVCTAGPRVTPGIPRLACTNGLESKPKQTAPAPKAERAKAARERAIIRPDLIRLSLLWLCGACLRLTVLAIPPVVPLLHADLHLSETEIGWLSSLPPMLFAIAAIPGALLIARFGILPALVMGLVDQRLRLRRARPLSRRDLALRLDHRHGGGRLDHAAVAAAAGARLVSEAHRLCHRDLHQRASRRRNARGRAHHSAGAAAGRRQLAIELRRLVGAGSADGDPGHRLRRRARRHQPGGTSRPIANGGRIGGSP